MTWTPAYGVRRSNLTKWCREVNLPPLWTAQKSRRLVDLGGHIERGDTPIHYDDGIDLHIYEVQIYVELEQRRQEGCE